MWQDNRALYQIWINTKEDGVDNVPNFTWIYILSCQENCPLENCHPVNCPPSNRPLDDWPRWIAPWKIHGRNLPGSNSPGGNLPGENLLVQYIIYVTVFTRMSARGAHLIFEIIFHVMQFFVFGLCSNRWFSIEGALFREGRSFE